MRFAKTMWAAARDLPSFLSADPCGCVELLITTSHASALERIPPDRVRQIVRVQERVCDGMVSK